MDPVKSLPQQGISANSPEAQKPSSKNKSIRQKVQSAGTRALDWVLPRNSVTLRREFHVIPSSLINLIGSLQYNSVCPLYKTVTDADDKEANRKSAKLVQEVGKKLAEHADVKFNYKFRLMDSKEVNAFCLPGGKTCITTGMIEKIDKHVSKKIKNKEIEANAQQQAKADMIAAVMGHEIAHACAHHGRARIEFGLILAAIGNIFSQVLGYVFRERAASQAEQDLRRCEPHASRGQVERVKSRARAEASGLVKIIDFFTIGIIYGLGKKIAESKFSQSHEHQSDIIGMLYAKKAGYDQKAGIWVQELLKDYKKEMELGERSDKILKYFSSHPPSEDRIQKCKKSLEIQEKAANEEDKEKAVRVLAAAC